MYIHIKKDGKGKKKTYIHTNSIAKRDLKEKPKQKRKNTKNNGLKRNDGQTDFEMKCI